jgi:NAD(P)-dependent dehydrogenase (short-subunit alcohol dehydrogenase family)
VTTVGIATGAGRGMGLACAERMVATVDTLLLVDLDAESVHHASSRLASSGSGAAVEPIVLDVTDRAGLQSLADRVAELGTLRAVAHAAGISPTMADWRRIFAVDLVGSAMLLEVLRPLAVSGTSIVCFASMAATLGVGEPQPEVDAAIDDPLHPGLFERVHEALGVSVEDPGMAYVWAKRGVRRLVQQEAVRLGPARARICSVSPGIIDTPQGRQEAAEHQAMAMMVEHTPLGREGQAEELAAVVSFLLSEEASFISGVDLLVDGGVCAALRGPSSNLEATGLGGDA